MNRDEVRQRLHGFVPSVHTIFHRDGRIDHNSIRQLVDFLIQGGSRGLMVTFGDSLLTVQSDAEIAEVNKTVIQHVKGRAVVIAAGRQWWTGQTVDFARHVRDLGADLLMVTLPDWAQSCTTDSLVEHYAAVARHMPVMVMTPTLQRTDIGQAVDAVRRIHDQVPGVVAVKEDWYGEFGRQLSHEVYGHWAIISGGYKENHLNAWPYGIDGYLSTFVKFLPRVAHEYWRAIEAGDVKAAARVVTEYDWPFFDFIGSFPDLYDSGLRGTMELFGVAPRWRRPPYHDLSEPEMERLRDFLKGRRWL